VWQYVGKFISVLPSGKIRFSLRKHFSHPVDFGFRVRSVHFHEMESTQDLYLKGIDSQQVLDSKDRLSGLMTETDLQIVTLWSDELKDWECFVYVGEVSINDLVERSFEE
jgi:hypothetical protein